MKVLFLIFHGFAESNGISKKIFYQVDALKSCGVETELCYLKIDEQGHRIRMIDSTPLIDYGCSAIAKLKKRFEFGTLARYVREKHFDAVYMRSDHNANPFLIGFLRAIKQDGIKIVMEIPTYPYDREYRGAQLQDRLSHFFDRCFRRPMAKYIDRIVTFSNTGTIFNVPAINISNGIDFNRIKMKTRQVQNGKQLNLIGVAEIHFWHAFDRVILGMAEYYKTTQEIEVIFHIVGSGGQQEMDKLTSLTAQYRLEPYIRFYGQKSGQELDDLFEKADMGIASLGRHRSGITDIKTLKAREYAARGIPFTYSENDSDFDNRPYVLKSPADESPLNINRLIEFYFSRPFPPEEIRNSIVRDLSWQTQIQKILNEISTIKP